MQDIDEMTLRRAERGIRIKQAGRIIWKKATKGQALVSTRRRERSIEC